MTNVRESVPFFGVRRMDASLRFYADGLEFAIKHRWEPEGKIRWCWLQLGGAALMLQEFSEPPSEKVGVGVSVCFMCADAIAIYRDAKSRGLAPREPFVGNRLWVTSFTDPDGYRIDFESPTDAPEDITLSEYEARSV